MRITNIFEAALIVKADPVLNSRQYSMVIYLPGTIFDKTTTSAERIEGALLPEGESYNDRTIEL